MHRSFSQARLITAVLASLASLNAVAMTIDGQLVPDEWAGAQRIDDFRLVQPLSRAPATLATEAYIMATPEGLAIAFRATQPATVPATLQRFQRDQAGSVDRVNIYVDFDGDGRSGYNFMVTRAGDVGDTTIANENRFNQDWDADWRYAAAETPDGWSAELLIPWHTATMQAADGETRTIGLSLDRVVGSTGERFGWPAITWTEPRFLSRLEKITVTNHEQSLLAITPYAVAVQDLVGQRTDTDAGADIFWKPSGQFQLSATLNPDFGQVESDALVVNFGAVETFFGDKRPFFTENQSAFDIGFGSPGGGGQSRLLYTRRVGAPADDGSGAGDVTAALKLNGSVGAFNYGVFAASEADPVGRDFYAARGTLAGEDWGFGGMLTEVRRPFLDRVARTLTFDPRWRPAETLDVSFTLVGSDVDQAGAQVRDSGAQLRIDHDLGEGWQQQLYVLHTGRDLQLNDFGFLDRNNLNYLRYERSRRITDLPAESAWASHQWRYAASTRYSDRGLRLFDTVAINQASESRSGGNRFWELAVTGPMNDDLILRGNGHVALPYRVFAFAEGYRPRQGDGRWEIYGNARYAREGIRGGVHGAKKVYAELSYLPSDALRLFTGLEYTANDDWLIWQGGNQLANFDARIVYLSMGMNWRISPKQEFRVLLENIGLRAQALDAWRVAADGAPSRSGESVDDFSLQNLGFQVRYRYELAPLSNLYIAYVRGGSLFDLGREFDSAYDQVGHAFNLRDSEQLLIKLSYRFTL